MAGKILVADRDPVYLKALAARIQQHCPAREVTTAADEFTYQTQLAKNGGELSLVVSAAHFPTGDLPAGVSQLILLENPLAVQSDKEKPHQPSSKEKPYQLPSAVRLGPVKPILKRLDMVEVAKQNNDSKQMEVGDSLPAEDSIPIETNWQASSAERQAVASINNTGQQGIPKSETGGQIPAKSENSKRIILLLTQTVKGRLANYADWRCAELSKTGNSICYLALMPNIMCRESPTFEQGVGSGLTDLLLRIRGGSMNTTELGNYMAIDRQGRLQVRPSDRADDLLDCQPQDLFHLVTLLRERVLATTDSVLVVEAAGISFRTVRAILPLFDSVETILPDDTGYAEKALLREISEALSGLSAGAELNQITEQAFKKQRILSLREMHHATV